ncbi:MULTISPECIES: hypothetical protein [Nocardia]|uniref:Uncharacterized protein n=1 Tax=Nocardia arthritidis TaxID=228602 RepID=A0A6G9YPZ4_9NOCA|nr:MULTISPECIES: hypothetical protein [Nocardia]QIS15157.1 hypothetical protein F5544_36645 [Nocardia arthritidis]
MRKSVAIVLGGAAVTLAAALGSGTAAADPVTDAVGPALNIAPAQTPELDKRRTDFTGVGALIGAGTGSAMAGPVGAAVGAAGGAAAGYGVALGTEQPR